MAIWFRMLLKPVLRFLPLDRAQLAEVLELLDSRARLLQRAQLCDAQAGWKLLECGGQIVWNSWFQDCEFKNGRVWVKFGDFDASCVQATKEESSVALFFLRIVQATSPVHLVEKEGPCVVAAADAFAERDVAGLGGWWLPPGCALSLANVKYFSCYIRRVDLPTWFLHDDDGKQVQSLQSCICALEALAQLVLLDARLRDGQSRASLGRVCVRQQCDNLGVVCSSSKGLSMRRPLCYVLQASAMVCMRERVNLRVSHVAGVRNVWADALSRGAEAAPEIWEQLRPERRCHQDWRALLDLGRLTL